MGRWGRLLLYKWIVVGECYQTREHWLFHLPSTDQYPMFENSEFVFKTEFTELSIITYDHSL